MVSPPPSSRTRIKGNTGPNAQVFINDPPPYPQTLKDRFPEMEAHQRAMVEWVRDLNVRLNPR